MLRFVAIAAVLWAAGGDAYAQARPGDQRSSDIRLCDRLGNRNGCRCALNNGGYVIIRDGQARDWYMERNWQLCSHNR
jgi:hypothetical protein